MIVSTTDKWGANAEHALAHQSKPVTRLRVQDLDDSPEDWSKFDPKRPQDLALRSRKTPKPHQDDAIKDVLTEFILANKISATHQSQLRTRRSSQIKARAFPLRHSLQNYQEI